MYRIHELAYEPSPEVRLLKIAGEDQPSNIFTKVLPRPSFEKLLGPFSWEKRHVNTSAQVAKLGAVHSWNSLLPREVAGIIGF